MKIFSSDKYSGEICLWFVLDIDNNGTGINGNMIGFRIIKIGDVYGGQTVGNENQL